jgi:hypothetical protein
MFNKNQMGFPAYRRNTGMKIFFFALSIIFAAYFINFPFNFFKVPESILKFQNWIIFAGGLLILMGLVNYLRASKKYI